MYVYRYIYAGVYSHVSYFLANTEAVQQFPALSQQKFQHTGSSTEVFEMPDFDAQEKFCLRAQGMFSSTCHVPICW